MDKDKLLMCRICMIEDVDMHYVVSDNVQETYEVLTRMTFATKKCRPLQVCYTCYARLENCYHLRALCLQTEELFTEILDKNGFPNNDGININNDDTYYGNDGTVDDTINAFVPIQNVPIKIKVFEDGYVENQGAGIENLDSKVVPNTGLVKSEDDITIETDEDFVKEENETVFEPSQLNKEEIKEQREEHSEVKDNTQPDARKGNKKRLRLSARRKKRNVPTKQKTIKHARTHNKLQLDKLEDHAPSFSYGELDMEVTYNTDKNTVEQIQSTSENSLNIEHKRDKEGVHERGDLQNHLHKCRKTFKCEKCQKYFHRKASLLVHMRLHMDEKCDICEKRFLSKSNLLNHMRVHTDEKPHKCDICNKWFGLSYDLVQHVRTHTGEKPYKCDLCPKDFICWSGLSKHRLIHTGEKPF